MNSLRNRAITVPCGDSAVFKQERHALPTHLHNGFPRTTSCIYIDSLVCCLQRYIYHHFDKAFLHMGSVEELKDKSLEGFMCGHVFNIGLV